MDHHYIDPTINVPEDVRALLFIANARLVRSVGSPSNLWLIIYDEHRQYGAEIPGHSVNMFGVMENHLRDLVERIIKCPR